MRLKNKVAMVIGAGQKPGPTLGNGRATAVLFAREGARVFAVDRNLDSAEETVGLIKKDGGEAVAFAADVTDESSLQAAVAACLERWQRIDVLH
ncbi:MAG: SDR family NAD(P)-dependent oxidoreductase, partial [Deltaproteobacteria bacterium]|nr:SDR family NAD(P)-dependent oxidoreductase [Deltaproteobacteria bacterium]